MAWLVLFIAGLFEVAWASLLPATKGFTRVWPTVAFGATLAVSMYLFTTYGSPKLMTLVISNLGNVALGFTSFFLLWVNYRLLPAQVQPRWYHRTGVAACGVFYLGMALLVFVEKQWPMIRQLL